MKPLFLILEAREAEAKAKALAALKAAQAAAELALMQPVEVVRGAWVDPPWHYYSSRPKSPWAMGWHPGDDWSTQSGARDFGKPVRSPVSGRVVHAGRGGWGEAYGIHVIIQAADGNRTALCHLQSESVSVGQAVQAGDTIGRLGDTGSGAAGPHVHVERRHAPYGYYDNLKPVYQRVRGG